MFKDYVRLNEGVKRNTLQWIQQELRKSPELKALSEGMGEAKVDKKALVLYMNQWRGDSYYGDKFWISPVNKAVGLAEGRLEVLYKGVVIYTYDKPIMVVGNQIANTGNQSLAGVTQNGIRIPSDFMTKTTNPIYIGHPGSIALHKIYSNQRNYVPKNPSSGTMTYYDTVELTDAAYKKVISIGKSDINIPDLLDIIRNHILTNAKAKPETVKQPEVKTVNSVPKTPASHKLKKEPKDPIHVGAYVFTKSDYEFYAKIIKIQGRKVTLSYTTTGEDQDYTSSTIDKNMIDIHGDGDEDGDLSLPNWTLN